MKKSSQTLYAVLAVMAALLVIGGIGLFWIAYRGVQLLKQEAAHAGTVMMGDAASLAGHADYVGTWEGGGIDLTILPGGTVTYSEKKANSSEKLNGSVSFDGDFMVLDVLVMKKRLHIDKAPHKGGARTLMTLDGTELEKK